MTFTQFVKNLHREESGQDLLEYALVLAAVLTAVVAGSASLATDIGDALTKINTKIQTAVDLSPKLYGAGRHRLAWRHLLQPSMNGLSWQLHRITVSLQIGY